MVRLIIYIHDILSLKKNQIYFIVPNGSDEDLKPCSDVKSDIDDNSKVSAATVLTSTSVLDNGHQDSDGKTYKYIHDILPLYKINYILVPIGSDEDLKPCSDVKSDIDDNSKVSAASVLTSTSVPDTGHQDSNGKTYYICTRYTFTLQNQRTNRCCSG